MDIHGLAMGIQELHMDINEFSTNIHGLSMDIHFYKLIQFEGDALVYLPGNKKRGRPMAERGHFGNFFYGHAFINPNRPINSIKSEVGVSLTGKSFRFVSFVRARGLVV